MTGRLEHGHTVGGTLTPTYRSWAAMLQRCYNPGNKRYANYGGRGISVCPAWRAGFEAFLRDMGERPAGKTLDRKKVDDDYTAANCRWATPREQALNRRPRTIASTCQQGHPRTPEHLLIRPNGARRCRTCDRSTRILREGL